MVLVMVRMLMMDGMLGSVGVVLIATVMIVGVVVMAVVIMLMLVTVLVPPMMGVVRVRRRGRGGGRGHRWLPFSLFSKQDCHNTALWLHAAYAACQVPTRHIHPLLSPCRGEDRHGSRS